LPFPEEIEYTDLLDLLKVLKGRDLLSPIEEFCPWIGADLMKQALARIF
jgi:hypothetical protein